MKAPPRIILTLLPALHISELNDRFPLQSGHLSTLRQCPLGNKQPG